MKNKKQLKNRNKINNYFYVLLYFLIIVITSVVLYFLTESLGNALLCLALGILAYMLVDYIMKYNTGRKLIIDDKKIVADKFYTRLYKNTISNVDFKKAYLDSVDVIHDENLKSEMIEYINEEKIVGLPPKLYNSTSETLVRIALYNMARLKRVRKENLRKYKVSLDNFVTVKKFDENIYFSFMFLAHSCYVFLLLFMIIQGA